MDNAFLNVYSSQMFYAKWHQPLTAAKSLKAQNPNSVEANNGNKLGRIQLASVHCLLLEINDLLSVWFLGQLL